MNFSKTNADIYIPSGMEQDKALSRTTHLAIGAHQDDVEIFAYHGISECFGQNNKWFSAVILTDGSGSSRDGIYANYTNEDMQKTRQQEQRKAAFLGEYSAAIQLLYPSSAVKQPGNKDVVDDLTKILNIARPEVLYLHNPADKHDTHVATMLRSIEAVRKLPKEHRPKKAFGCEVWRSLDWLCDNDKVVMSVGKQGNIAAALMGVFDSQITGGKRYDLATSGRRLSNATFFESHNTDQDNALQWAVDLTPMFEDDNLSIETFILSYIDRFRDDVTKRISKFMRG